MGWKRITESGDCSKCGGTGQCPRCRGEGVVYCKKCDGYGRLQSTGADCPNPRCRDGVVDCSTCVTPNKDCTCSGVGCAECGGAEGRCPKCQKGVNV